MKVLKAVKVFGLFLAELHVFMAFMFSVFGTTAACSVPVFSPPRRSSVQARARKQLHVFMAFMFSVFATTAA